MKAKVNTTTNMHQNIALYIQDNSMAPTIANGDMVICRELAPLEKIEENEVYAVVTNTGAIMIKRVQKIKNGNNKIIQLKLISDNNSEQPSLRIPINNIRTLLKVEDKLAATA